MGALYRVALIIATILLITACAQAEPQTDPVSSDKFFAPPESTAKPAPTDSAKRALQSLESRAMEFGLTSPHDQLAFVDETVDTDGQKHIRFNQKQDGIPVWSGQLIAHLNADESLRDVSASIVPLSGSIDLTASLTPKDARDAALRLSDIKGHAEEPQLFVYANGQTAHLVYSVTVVQGFNREILFIDAHSGQLRKRLEGTQRARE